MMTPDQLRDLLAYIEASKSPRPRKDSKTEDDHRFLRGFNAGLEHVQAWLYRNKIGATNELPLTANVPDEVPEDRIGEYR